RRLVQQKRPDTRRPSTSPSSVLDHPLSSSTFGPLSSSSSKLQRVGGKEGEKDRDSLARPPAVVHPQTHRKRQGRCFDFVHPTALALRCPPILALPPSSTLRHVAHGRRSSTRPSAEVVLVARRRSFIVVIAAAEYCRRRVNQIPHWREGRWWCVSRKRPSTSLVGGEGVPLWEVEEAGHIPQRRGVALGDVERGREARLWLRATSTTVSTSLMLRFGEFRSQTIGWAHRAGQLKVVVVIDDDEIGVDSCPIRKIAL
ncbi:hypothetical protein BDN70DRAFT_985211, partial [Pholiota conissans]